MKSCIVPVHRVPSARTALALVLALGVVASATSASAQCRPDDIFCAELRIGPADPPPPPPPPPPPVVVIPAPPPPVVVAPPPPPPVVVVRPAPPPPPPQRAVVVVQPARPQPAQIQVEVATQRTTRYELVPAFDLGLHIFGAGVMAENVGMGGMGIGFRLRPVEWLGLDLSVAGYYGTDFQGAERGEVPITGNVLFFFNPRHRVQFYALVGVGTSFARTGDRIDRMRDGAEFIYVGGEAGIGLEWRIARRFALNFDVRGFLRERVGGDGREFEFTRPTESGGIQGTNTSGGFYGTLGMTFYFGG